MSGAEDGSSSRRIVVSLAFGVVAFAARIVSWPLVLRDTGVQPAGSDAFYHLRRITYSVENFPELLSRDPYLNYPHGGEVIWSPAFDWLLAALAWLFVGPGDPEAVARWAVWVPPLLGASTVALLYLVAARYFSKFVALLAAGLLALLPAHIVYSRIGAVDHHVAVALCALWLFATGLRLLESRRGSLALGLSLAASLLLWPGMLIHVATLQLGLALRAICESERQQAVAFAWRLAGGHAVACALLLPFSTTGEWELWGAFSPVVLSSFQPIYLGAAAFGFAGLGALWQRASFPPSFAARLGQAIALLAMIAGLALGLLPALGAAALDAWQWFSKAEEFQASVAESAPLFWRGRGLDPGHAELLLSRAIYLAPFSIVWLALAGRRSGGDPLRSLLLLFATVFLAATLTQRRFMNSFSIFYVLLMALAVERAVAAFRARFGERPGAERGIAAAALLIAGFSLLPLAGWYSNDLANLGRRWQAVAPRAVGTELVHETLIPVARWLRANTPETQGFFDASLQPEYALLSSWGDGHLLTYVARRPEVQGNFGDDVGEANFALAEEYFAALREERAAALLDEVGARYVIAGPRGSGHASGYSPQSLWSRLYVPVREAALATTRRDPPEIWLTRHRLVHTSRRPPRGAALPFYAVYERVAGAEVSGNAPPGARVEARLRLVTGDHAELRFVTQALANAEGRYRLRLPYATAGGASSVQVGQRYRITSGGEQASFGVSEGSVRSGATLVGPSFGAPS